MTPVIIDCDPGTDDAIALFFALASDELDVRLVTTVGGNTGLANTTRNACSIIGLTGRAVPVVRGSEGPLLGSFTAADHVHGLGGIGGVILPEGPPAHAGIAADAIRSALRNAPEAGLTLVGIGPVTNLALALATEPELTKAVAEIVLMTGAWGEGNVTTAAEFNAWSDPEALAILLSCRRPVTFATLELTAQALCTPSWLESLSTRGNGACLKAASAIIASVPLMRRHDFIGVPQHDLCAVAYLACPSLFTHSNASAEIDVGYGPARGRTLIGRWGDDDATANIRLLQTVDATRLFAALADRLASLP